MQLLILYHLVTALATVALGGEGVRSEVREAGPEPSAAAGQPVHAAAGGAGA